MPCRPLYPRSARHPRLTDLVRMGEERSFPPPTVLGSAVVASLGPRGAAPRPMAQARRRIPRSEVTALISETDKEILVLLTEHRVATTIQVHRFLDLPERTARYRLERLRSLGLVGSVRPYAERGSAPHHWYPSRVADAWATGAPVPRGGERDAPNPAFVRHAAAITGLYVALVRTGPSLGFTLHSWAREAEAAEEFDAQGRRTAIVPDLTVALSWGQADYRAFVEVDLGTMSLPRLSRKLRGYAAYARERAWGGRHPFPPTLLFLTTTRRRAEAVIREWVGLLGNPHGRRPGARSWPRNSGDRPAVLFVGATDAVVAPDVALSDPVWLVPGGRDGLLLRGLLDPPWRVWAKETAERETKELALRVEEARRVRDPSARREHLQRSGAHFSFRRHLEALGEEDGKALQFLLDGTGDMSPIERAAFSFFDRRARSHPDRVEVAGEAVPLAEEERLVLSDLHAEYLHRQRRGVASAWAQDPESPTLRGAIRNLHAGRLVDPLSWTFLEDRERSDRSTFTDLQARVSEYLAWRDGEVERRRASLPAARRLLFRTDQAALNLDREHMLFCRDCEQVLPHIPGREPWRRPWCPFCRTHDLLAVEDAVRRGMVEPDGRGYWRVCHPPVPGWVRAMAAVPCPEAPPGKPRGEEQT